MPLNILGLGGSTTAPSTSVAALRVALAGAEAAGATTSLLDLSALDLPMYRHAGEPPAVAVQLVEAVTAADGLIWSSPLYHGAMSGLLKNALDWLELLDKRVPPYLADKPVGLVATAGGMQALQAINNMEQVVRALRGHTVPLVGPINRAWQVFDDQGAVKDPKVERMLRGVGEEVVRVARKFAGAERLFG